MLGASGQLGQEFLRQLGPRCVGLDRSQLDLEALNFLSDPESALARVLAPLNPAVVINAAAYNNVDLAETHRQSALAVNSQAPAHLARLAARCNWRLLHFSTDYVFGGDGLTRPRLESDPPAPVNFYGYSKLLGEEAVLRGSAQALVLRVAHLYGGESRSPGRANLVRRFIALARADKPITVVAGQTLNPTSIRELTAAALDLTERGACGLFHLTGGGQCSAAEFAAEVLGLAGLRTPILTAARDSRPARRPTFTVLENRRWNALGFPPLADWRASLQLYLNS